ncbi:MAG: hypothetical protein WAL75_25855 [Terracidiphilus sp.]
MARLLYRAGNFEVDAHISNDLEANICSGPPYPVPRGESFAPAPPVAFTWLVYPGGGKAQSY